MKYLHSVWSHNFKDEPIFFYYEIGSDNYAKRQIEVFADFSCNLNSEDVTIGNAFLTPMKFNFAELFSQNDDEIFLTEISAELFNHLWNFFITRCDDKNNCEN